MTRQQHQVARGAASVACLTLAACGDHDNESPYSLERKGTKVVVTPIYQDCETNADCILMEITCDFCCTRDAIATRLADAFENERAIACADYEGPVCACIPQPASAQCIEGSCVAVAK